METTYSVLIKKAFKLLEKEHKQKKEKFLKEWIEEKKQIEKVKEYTIKHVNNSLIKECAEALSNCE